MHLLLSEPSSDWTQAYNQQQLSKMHPWQFAMESAQGVYAIFQGSVLGLETWVLIVPLPAVVVLTLEQLPVWRLMNPWMCMIARSSCALALVCAWLSVLVCASHLVWVCNSLKTSACSFLTKLALLVVSFAVVVHAAPTTASAPWKCGSFATAAKILGLPPLQLLQGLRASILAHEIRGAKPVAQPVQVHVIQVVTQVVMRVGASEEGNAAAAAASGALGLAEKNSATQVCFLFQ